MRSPHSGGTPSMFSGESLTGGQGGKKGEEAGDERKACIVAAAAAPPGCQALAPACNHHRSGPQAAEAAPAPSREARAKGGGRGELLVVLPPLRRVAQHVAGLRGEWGEDAASGWVDERHPQHSTRAVHLQHPCTLHPPCRTCPPAQPPARPTSVTRANASLAPGASPILSGWVARLRARFALRTAASSASGARPSTS